ncbi:MAG: amidohydrolase family protein [Armatimonadota bacterium]
MVIDVHHHLPRDYKPYVEKVQEACSELGIDRVVMCSSGPPQADNDTLAQAQEDYPDFLLCLGYMRLGEDNVRTVDRIMDLGLRGIKVIRPLDDYDADEYMPMYARAASFGLTMLFHLGIVARGPRDPFMDVSIDRMRPSHRDRIARSYPDLNIIGAHLGNPWYGEAGEVARMHPNVYFDLTGSTMKKKDPAFIDEVFWWAHNEQYGLMGDSHPYEKIVFGTDVGPDLMGDVMGDYRHFMDYVDMEQKYRDLIWGGTAMKLLGVEE